MRTHRAAIHNRARDKPENGGTSPGPRPATRNSVWRSLALGTPDRNPIAISSARPFLLQRQPAGGSGSQSSTPTVRERVETLIEQFKRAKGIDDQNVKAMAAIDLIISEFHLSTEGVYVKRFEPKLSTAGRELCDEPRKSRVLFGPEAFGGGFEFLVSIVAHELEHVRQCRLGIQNLPLSEFLAYSVQVLAVGLPPLPPDHLRLFARKTLDNWNAMLVDDQRAYWSRFEATREKLRQRIASEAPKAVREGSPAPSDPFTQEFTDWLEATSSPWQKVKELLEEFDAVQPPKPLQKPPYQPYPHRWYA